jgi:hypothetical protein
MYNKIDIYKNEILKLFQKHKDDTHFLDMSLDLIIGKIYQDGKKDMANYIKRFLE